MKSYSLELTVRQLQEIRNLLFTIIGNTDVIHQLTYPEQYLFQKGYAKLLSKCQTQVFRNQKKTYRTSFVPPEADVFIKIFLKNNIPLTKYAAMTVSSFMGQVDKQSADLQLTFLSQFPYVNSEFAKKE